MARLIHEEFWTTVPGASAEAMEERLTQAAQADKLPLCLVALQQGRPIGVVNLVDDDDDDHTDWWPWLAGMVVAEEWRGRGVGSALVVGLLDHARRLGIARVYFGTDGPGFYTRLGALRARTAARRLLVHALRSAAVRGPELRGPATGLSAWLKT